MLIGDYLLKPDRSPPTDEEEEALGEILATCCSASTALLQLYRLAILSHQESEDLVDEVERLQKLHNDEVCKLRGEPVDIFGRDPLRANQ